MDHSPHWPARIIYVTTAVGLFAFDLMVNFGPWGAIGRWLGIGFGVLDAGIFLVNLIALVAVLLILRDIVSHIRQTGNNLERTESWSKELQRRVSMLVWAVTALHLVRAGNLLFCTAADCNAQGRWRLVARDTPGFVYLAGGILMLIATSAVAKDLYAAIARRVTHRGYCHACGYDLRGNRESTECPECGADVRLDHQYQ